MFIFIINILVLLPKQLKATHNKMYTLKNSYNKNVKTLTIVHTCTELIFIYPRVISGTYNMCVGGGGERERRKSK